MTVIAKADIITDVNENLQTAFSGTGTDLDRAIIKVLTDMSNKNLLVGTDTDQTLATDDTTLDYPTGFRSAISITLIDGSGATKKPLRKLTRGHKEYRELRENDNSSGITEWFSELNKQFFLWRPANEAFTTLIEYYKNHAKTADSIEFETEFENVMFAGATYYKALALGRERMTKIWGPEYDRQLRMAPRNIQPSIVGE